MRRSLFALQFLFLAPVPAIAAPLPHQQTLEHEARQYILPCMQINYVQRLACHNGKKQFLSEYVKAIRGSSTYQWDVGFFFSKGAALGVLRSEQLYCAFTILSESDANLDFPPAPKACHWSHHVSLILRHLKAEVAHMRTPS